MKKAFSLALTSLLLSAGCSLVSPYTLTFTNTPGSVVEPDTSTLDLVVSAPTLAYVSGVSCEGADAIELLPIVQDSSAVSTLHKLPLTAMKGMPEGALCEVTVTVFDPTTTETASNSIAVTMKGVPLSKEGEMCGGEAGFQCSEGLTCVIEAPDPMMSDASGTCMTEEEVVEDSTEPATEEETAAEVEVETSVETAPVESSSESNDQTDANPSESTDAAGTDEQGA